MHLLDVLYTNYSRFYYNVIPDPQPHVAAVLALSFSESLAINCILQIALIKWLCTLPDTWFPVTITVIIIFINYMCYVRTGKFKTLEKKKMTINGSYKLSLIITWFFFLLTTSWLFWGPIYSKYLFDQCR